MKKISFKDTKFFLKNKDNAKIYEYNVGQKEIDACVVEISGRYPYSGWAINQICTEVIYVLFGEGIIYTLEENQKFTNGDVLVIKPKEKYFFEGKFKIFISCSPAWSPEQYQIEN